MIPEEKPSVERRKHVRIKKNYILRFSDRNNPSLKFDVSQIENVSKGGLCFTSGIPFVEKTLINIELRTPYLYDTAHLEGQIIQCREKVSGLIYENHLKFQNLTPKAEDILEKIERFNTSKGRE